MLLHLKENALDILSLKHSLLRSKQSFFAKAFSINCLTLIQPGKGRFTLAYMSHDYLHGSHAGLPGWIRVNLQVSELHECEWFSHTNFGFLHWFSMLLKPESIRNYEENKL